MTSAPVYRRGAAYLMAPALAFWALLLALPLIILAVYSVRTPEGWSLANYARAFDPMYGRILLRSIAFALFTTAISLALAYPAAWAIRCARRSWQLPLLALVAVPSWLNLLVKNYAWIVLLRRQGVINSLLVSSGMVSTPLPLLFNDGAVLVGLIHSYLPFMVLPIYAALERVDDRLIEAARDLGAGSGVIFRRVLVPLTARAAGVGAVLVFTATLGAFVTPDLLGGPSSLLIASVIESQVLQVRDWNFASALAMLLFLATIGVMLLARLRRSSAEPGS